MIFKFFYFFPDPPPKVKINRTVETHDMVVVFVETSTVPQVESYVVELEGYLLLLFLAF